MYDDTKGVNNSLHLFELDYNLHFVPFSFFFTPLPREYSLNRALFNDSTDSIRVHRFIDTAKVLKHFDTLGMVKIIIASKKINQCQLRSLLMKGFCKLL
jgi:hypothetical protein